ncbi:SIMPL domain-containing protein [Sphingomonas cavernae]|uniref:SIMPL domain-containing protein n=1 Tax=Sphingomonas cavernae TaxID=2320861 RepID=A0A418WPX8_9SPHN|nr:SIMPL domain-containing protein [Sphingomonas cavernae]RJF93307.1 SIMPL domain-containing protein [Sphingomonas cavernae]
MHKTFPALALAALAATPAALSAQSTVAVPVPVIQGTKLDIVATGETRRVPDVAVINAGVVTQGADAASAMRENAQRMARVTAALKKAGIADRDIQTSTVNLQPQYRYGENVPPVITGYQATNTVTVRFRDVGKSGTILDALVAEGANQINGPSLQIDKPEAAEDEARVDAIKKARARAVLYAGAAGLKVKRILSISEAGGYAPPPPMPYVMASRGKAEADTAIAPGEQTVGVTVTVSFELE